MRLKYRLLLAMATIVVISLVSSGVLVSREFESLAIAEASSELQTARDVFEAFHQVRYRLLLADCRVVAQSPVLKAVVSTPGVARETIENTAQEMHQVVGSSLFMLVNSQGVVLTSVARPDLAGRSLASEPLVAQALTGGQATGFWSENNRLYQVVAVPLRFDTDIFGALVLGYLVDSHVAEELARMTHSQVAFFEGARMVAASLPPTVKPAGEPLRTAAVLERHAKSWANGPPPARPFDLELMGERYLALVTPLPGSGANARATVMIVKTLEHALATSRQLTRHLAGVGALALLVALVLSFWGARAVVVPIQELVDVTKAIAAGDLSRRVPHLGTGGWRSPFSGANDEVRELAESFDEMVSKLEASTAEIVAARDYIDNVLKSMSDSLMVVEPDGTIRTTNQATVDLVNIPREGLVGQPFTSVLADGGAGLTRGNLFDALEHGIENRELSYLTAQGESIPVTISASPVRDPFGKAIGAVVVARDLRQILKLQQELAHREKLASLGQLAAGLAHEIRNPLAVIRFASGYLQKHTTPGTGSRPERITQSFEDIGHEVQRMGDLIDELLLFSKRPQPEVGGVDVNEMLTELSGVLAKRDELGQVKLTFDCNPEVPRIHVAKEPLRRILLNLTINALQAMGGKGSLTVKAWPDMRAGTTGAAIAVVDTGPGIPPEIKAKIFDPFFTTKRSGTGLGLFICSQTIHGMGGTIDLDTEVGKGTTFTLWMRPRTDSVV